MILQVSIVRIKFRENYYSRLPLKVLCSLVSFGTGLRNNIRMFGSDTTVTFYARDTLF